MATLPILTSGPTSGVTQIYSQRQGTLDELQARLADEIDDTHNEYAGVIQASIFSAIRLIEREPLYFNESREISFFSQEGQGFYDRVDHKDIPRLGGLQAAYIERGDGFKYQLRRASQEDLEVWDEETASLAEPLYYGYFGQRLRLFPRPDASYVIRLQIAPMRFDDVTIVYEPSIWLIEAFDLIRARAKYELYKDILKDVAQAQAALADYHEHLEAIRLETSRRHATGTLRVTCF